MRRAVAPLLAVTVAVVLADSAVVTLALPAILRNLHTSVGQVAWVLISFNLVLGLVAVPVGLLFTRARPRLFCALGIAVFAAASAWCASATSIEVLVAARCVQALGGAAALIGCLELLVAQYGERRGVAVWVTSGVVGTAVGPVAGGLLTQAFSWQAIFVVQVPIALLAVPAALSVPAVPALAAGPTSPGAAAQPDAGSAVGRAHRGAVPAGPAAGRGAGTARRRWPRWRCPSYRSQRSRLGRSPASCGPPDEVEVAVGCFLIAGGLVGLALPALGRPRVDDRSAGTGRAGARTDPRPADRAGDAAAAAAGGARGLDDRCSSPRRGRGAGHPDAGLHDGPAGRAGARPGGDHLVGARRPAAAAGQDRGGAGARPAAVGPAGPGPRPAAGVRDAGSRPERTARGGRRSSAISTRSWSGPPRGRSATRSWSAPGSRCSRSSSWSRRAGGRRRDPAFAPGSPADCSRWSWWPSCSAYSSRPEVRPTSPCTRPTRARPVRSPRPPKASTGSANAWCCSASTVPRAPSASAGSSWP